MPQPHGGALRRGNPGNVGGPGIPASELRKVLRGSFAERVKILEQFADGVIAEAQGADRLRAIDMLGKYGLGESKAEVHGEASPQVVAGMIAVRDAAFKYIPPEHQEQAGQAMADAWKQAVQS